MKTARVLRCTSCKRRIREHHPDLEVLEASTGRRLYYHEWCTPEAFARARRRGGAYLATRRTIDAEAN